MDGIQNILKEKFKTKDIKRKLILSLIYVIVTGLIYLATKLTGLIFSVNLVFIHITLRGLCFGLFLLAAIWIIYALSLILDARKKIIPRVIISLIIAAIVLFTVFAGLMIGLGADTYYEFISDDGKNIAVVSEYNFLFSTTLNMYKRENLFFLRKIEDYFYTGDQGYIMDAGIYEVKWDGPIFKLSFEQKYGPYNYEYNLNDY